MNIFYTPELTTEKTYTLSESESKHAIRVLRLKQGDVLTLVNGIGSFFEATITSDNAKRCEVEITEIRKEENNKSRMTKPAMAIRAVVTSLKTNSASTFLRFEVSSNVLHIEPQQCRCRTYF